MLVNISASEYRYRPKADDDEALRHRLRELAGQRKRFGSPRLHIMLKRENLVVNHKHTERIYRKEDLALRRKRRRKGAAGIRAVIPTAVNLMNSGPWILSLIVLLPDDVSEPLQS